MSCVERGAFTGKKKKKGQRKQKQRSKCRLVILKAVFPGRWGQGHRIIEE